MIADQRPRAHLQEFNVLRSQNVTSRGVDAIRELMTQHEPEPKRRIGFGAGEER